MVKNYFLSFFFISVLAVGGLRTTVQAQTVIGMGTDQPNPNAVLELVPENGNQGFLAPRLTTAQRQASSFTSKLTRADNGLLVFDVNEGQFYYWFDGAWRAGTSGGAEGGSPGVSGTTWYTGTAAPDGVNATEGDFYINESTGEVFRFSGNTFASIGSLAGVATSAPNLSSVLQQGASAENQKISKVGNPTESDDAATKGYVDAELSSVSSLNPNLKAILDQGSDADNKKITNLGSPTDDKDAANKKYVDDQVSSVTIIGGSTPNLETVLGEGSDANGKITKLTYPTDVQDAANKQYVDDRESATRTYVDQEILAMPGGNPSLDDVLNNNNNASNKQIIGLLDPTEVHHAATKGYVDNEISNVVLTAQPPPGLGVVLGESSDANSRITNLSTPTSPNDAANKAYVDSNDADDQPLDDVLNKGNDAQGLQIINLGTPTLANHTATKAYVDSEITSATLPGGSVPTLEDVLNKSNNANNQKIIGLADPDDPKDAANKEYVDNRGLDDVLNTSNNAGNNQIIGLASPSAASHATNRKYVDDRDETLKQYVNDESIITAVSITGSNILNITEGPTTHTVTISGAGTPASLETGKFFIGNTSDDPVPVTISGHITISASGVATITDAVITKEKINADVAGPGLSKNTTNGSLQVNAGNGLSVSGDEIRINPSPKGWLGVGQGLANNMGFKEVGGDATLNEDAKLTVKGLLGQPIGSTATAIGQVLRWNGSSWVPATISGGGSTADGARQDGRINITQPTSANRAVGTLWLDENGGVNNKGSLKIWNGTTWVEILKGDKNQ